MKVILKRTSELRKKLSYYLELVANQEKVVAVSPHGSHRSQEVVVITLEEFKALRKAAGQEGKGLLTAKAAVAAAPPPPPDLTFIS